MAVPWYPRIAASLLTVLTVLTLLTVAGCGGGGLPQPSETSRSATTPSVPDPGTGDSVEGDINAAVSITNTYWSTHWNEFFTGTYRPPRVLGAYDGATGTAPACGGTPLPNDNAVYCPGGDYVAWDMDLMRAGHQRGDAWVYLVIAHEWGHAVQNRLDAGLVDLARELQADCLAGAVLFGAARDTTLTFEDGDIDELSDALSALADETPWTNTSDHGNASQRVSAFSRGAESGVKGCLPNAVR